MYLINKLLNFKILVTEIGFATRLREQFLFLKFLMCMYFVDPKRFSLTDKHLKVKSANFNLSNTSSL